MLGTLMVSTVIIDSILESLVIVATNNLQLWYRRSVEGACSTGEQGIESGLHVLHHTNLRVLQSRKSGPSLSGVNGRSVMEVLHNFYPDY